MIETFIHVTAERTLWRPANSEKYRYYLAADIRARGDIPPGYVVQLTPTIHVTSPVGDVLPDRTVNSRRKHVSKTWTNHEWTSRLFAFAEFLASGTDALKEIFLHYRSEISGDEYAGYREACPGGVRLVAIRVRPDRYSVRLFRPGFWPVLRGTFWKVSERTGFLWGSGFKPRWETYDGWEMPVPLRMDMQHGSADIGQVARDIFALTKLNYNACRLGNAQPVTIGFSDAVGEILVANPLVPGKKPNFKFYV